MVRGYKELASFHYLQGVKKQCSGSGIRCLFDPWIRDLRWVKNQDPETGLEKNNLDHFPRAEKIFLRLKDLNSLTRPKFFNADLDPGSGTFLTLDPGSGMEKIQIRDKHPDPQHC
jgi:hypothetical protein